MSLHETPLRENFTMKAVKSIDLTSLQITAESTKANGVQYFTVPYSGTYEITPHPDLTDLFKSLKDTLAQWYGYTSIRSVVNEPRFKADKAQIKHIESFIEQRLEKIRVTGISLSGNDMDKIAIKGTYDGNPINTKPIHFSTETYDGEKLKEISKSLEDEVFEYLFKDKKSEMDLFDDDEQNQEEPELELF